MRDEGVDRYDRHIRLAEKVTGQKAGALVDKFMARVLVTGDAAWLQSPEGRLTALTAANLIARFCPRIDFDFRGAETMQREALDLVQRIDRRPVAEFRSLTEEVSWVDYEAVLCLGRTGRVSPNATSVIARGWLAAVSSSGPPPALPDAPYNPFGPILGACFGAAEVFKRLLHAGPQKLAFLEPSVFSAYSYQVWDAGGTLDSRPALPQEIELPATLLAGAGAVGNAFGYALAEVPGVHGELAIVDREDVEDETNLNRYSLGLHDDACGPVHSRKVDLIDRVLKSTRVRCVPHKEEIEAYLKRLFAQEESRPRAIISAVDNNDIRPSLQRLWPDILIEGATSDSLFQVSRHAYAEGLACLMCIHTIESTADARPYEEFVAERSGLSPTAIRQALRDADRVVTEVDIAAAPEEKRAFLRHRLGRSICTVLSELEKLSADPNSVPAAATVSFVSMAAGTLAAAELVKCAAGLGSPLETLYQMDMFMPFENAMLLPTEKLRSCECYRRHHVHDRYRAIVYGRDDV